MQSRTKMTTYYATLNFNLSKKPLLTVQFFGRGVFSFTSETFIQAQLVDVTP